MPMSAKNDNERLDDSPVVARNLRTDQEIHFSPGVDPRWAVAYAWAEENNRLSWLNSYRENNMLEDAYKRLGIINGNVSFAIGDWSALRPKSERAPISEWNPIKRRNAHEGASPDLSAVDEFGEVYYSVDGAPFVRASGEVRVELPVGNGASLLQNATQEGVIVDLFLGEDVEAISQMMYGDILMADGMNGKGFELLDSMGKPGFFMPDVPVPEHPALTLLEGTVITINGEPVEAKSISVASLYLNKDDAGEMIRLQLDFGVEGTLITVRADDRVIGANFNPMGEILASTELMAESSDSTSPSPE